MKSKKILSGVLEVSAIQVFRQILNLPHKSRINRPHHFSDFLIMMWSVPFMLLLFCVVLSERAGIFRDARVIRQGRLTKQSLSYSNMK